jgi:hypothetical protein
MSETVSRKAVVKSGEAARHAEPPLVEKSRFPSVVIDSFLTKPREDGSKRDKISPSGTRPEDY